jgi:hypothetical protein
VVLETVRCWTACGEQQRGGLAALSSWVNPSGWGGGMGLLGCSRRENGQTSAGSSGKKGKKRKRKRRSGLAGLEWAARGRTEKKRNASLAGPGSKNKRKWPKAGFEYRKYFSISNLL